MCSVYIRTLCLLYISSSHLKTVVFIHVQDVYVSKVYLCLPLVKILLLFLQEIKLFSLFSSSQGSSAVNTMKDCDVTAFQFQNLSFVQAFVSFVASVLMFIYLIFMEPCIVVRLVAITNKMQLSNGILLFHSTLTVQHVSSVMSLIIRNLNCICSFWFTYACGDRPWCRLSGNWFRYSPIPKPVPTQTAPRAVSTSVRKPEAANTVEVPDDERHNARNVLNY